MICSLRATVFYFSSLHLFFSIIQMAVLPSSFSGLGERTVVSTLGIFLTLFFLASGFMIFRGVDEESGTLVRLGSLILIIVTLGRHTLILLDVGFIDYQPESHFLIEFGITVKMIFSITHYLIYLVLVFFYQRQLRKKSSNSRMAA